MHYLRKKGNGTFIMVYALFATKMDICQGNVRTESTRKDLNQERTKENIGRRRSDSQQDIIFEPPKWMTVPKKKKKMSKSLANQMKNK